jgi:hypothetical protein
LGSGIYPSVLKNEVPNQLIQVPLILHDRKPFQDSISTYITKK